MATPHSHNCNCGHHHESEHQLDQYALAFSKYELQLCDQQVQLAVQDLLKENREKFDETDVFLKLFSTLELTSLNTSDTEDTILQLVENVNQWYEQHPDFPHLATLCVYPNFVKLVAESLDTEQIKVAAVSAAFPSSQTFLEVKTIETALAVQDGAEEIDVVLPVGAFLNENYEICADEISELKSVCGDRILKVILETSLLKQASQIKKAALFAMYAGADFIKTSTGKEGSVATLDAVLVMCTAIKEYEQETGRRIGLKVAGGVRL